MIAISEEFPIHHTAGPFVVRVTVRGDIDDTPGSEQEGKVVGRGYLRLLGHGHLSDSYDRLDTSTLERLAQSVWDLLEGPVAELNVRLHRVEAWMNPAIVALVEADPMAGLLHALRGELRFEPEGA